MSLSPAFVELAHAADATNHGVHGQANDQQAPRNENGAKVDPRKATDQSVMNLRNKNPITQIEVM